LQHPQHGDRTKSEIRTRHAAYRCRGAQNCGRQCARKQKDQGPLLLPPLRWNCDRTQKPRAQASRATAQPSPQHPAHRRGGTRSNDMRLSEPVFVGIHRSRSTRWRAAQASFGGLPRPPSRAHPRPTPGRRHPRPRPRPPPPPPPRRRRRRRRRPPASARPPPRRRARMSHPP